MWRMHAHTRTHTRARAHTHTHTHRTYIARWRREFVGQDDAPGMLPVASARGARGKEGSAGCAHGTDDATTLRACLDAAAHEREHEWQRRLLLSRASSRAERRELADAAERARRSGDDEDARKARAVRHWLHKALGPAFNTWQALYLRSAYKAKVRA